MVIRYAQIRTLAFSVVRMRYRYPWRVAGVGVALAAAGLLLVRIGHPTPGHRLVGLAALVMLMITAWWVTRHVGRPQSTRALIKRRAELDQRSGGGATGLDVAEVASPAALRLQARVLRPAITTGMSWWQIRRMGPRQLGVLVAKTGFGLPWGQQVWSTVEDATLRIGGPRMGKTITLAPYGLAAPGALITTSTRLDLAEALHGVRLRRGAVHIFNPAALGGVPSTVRWRVLDGCEDYATANRRAADLIPRSDGDRDLWDTQARRILSILLNAAALSGRSMRDVVRWSGGQGEEELKEVVSALLDSEDGAARGRVSEIRGFWETNDRTRSSIATTMAIPLAWLSDARARALGDAEVGDPALIEITELIQRGQTLHLLGHEQHGTISPLIGAFVAEIAYTARTLAAQHLNGRLDPPVTMLLDEAAIVVPVPLDEWTADMGGSGITLHISVQSLAQMRARWGTDRATALLANIACFIIFGGSAVHDDLADISALTGNHRMKVIGIDHTHVDRDRDGELRGEYQWVPVLSAAQIRAMPPGQVLVLRRHLPAVIGVAPRHTVRARDRVRLPRSREEAVAQLEAALTGRSTPSSRGRLARVVTGATARIPMPRRRPVSVPAPRRSVDPVQSPTSTPAAQRTAWRASRPQTAATSEASRTRSSGDRHGPLAAAGRAGTATEPVGHTRRGRDRPRPRTGRPHHPGEEPRRGCHPAPGRAARAPGRPGSRRRRAGEPTGNRTG